MCSSKLVLDPGDVLAESNVMAATRRLAIWLVCLSALIGTCTVVEHLLHDLLTCVARADVLTSDEDPFVPARMGHSELGVEASAEDVQLELAHDD